jgi:methionyl aminopeptidase
MVLAIEPMVNVGDAAVKVLGDGWTAVTRDGTLSAHFEHTVVVTGGGCEILTLLGTDPARARESVNAAVRT